MDMIFKRYACPFPFIEQMLTIGRFEEFIDEFVEIHNEEMADTSMWELYLHHSFLDESFEDFKMKCKVPNFENYPKADLEATVKESFNMLDDFVPDDDDMQ